MISYLPFFALIFMKFVLVIRSECHQISKSVATIYINLHCSRIFSHFTIRQNCGPQNWILRSALFAWIAGSTPAQRVRTVKLDSTVRTLQQLRPEYTIIMISFLDFENHENCAYSRYLNFPNFRYLNFDINDLAFNLQAAAQLAPCGRGFPRQTREVAVHIRCATGRTPKSTHAQRCTCSIIRICIVYRLVLLRKTWNTFWVRDQLKIRRIPDPAGQCSLSTNKFGRVSLKPFYVTMAAGDLHGAYMKMVTSNR